MDLPVLFAATLSPDANVRKRAELEVRRVGKEEGLVGALLEIIGTGGDTATLQACAIYIKNRIFSSYTLSPEHNGLPESDRAALRRALLPLLSRAPPAVIPTLAATLKLVVSTDFGGEGTDKPQGNWPSFLPELTAYLSPGRSIRETKAGVLAALEAMRAFRYHPRQENVQRVGEAVFPRLGEIAGEIVGSASVDGFTSNPENDAAAELLHLILKVYRTSTAIGLSEHQRSNESLVVWGRVLFGVVGLKLQNGEGKGEDSEWWKAKKWAYSVLGRLFSRYGNPSQLPQTLKKEYKPFASHFVSVYAPEILGVYLKQVDMFVRGEQWMSEKCQYHVFTFFTECIKPASTWALLKPHFPSLIAQFVFPLLSFTTARAELWESDPVDYVRVGLDEYENYQTAVGAGTTFLLALVSNRGKAAFQPILAFLMGVLTSSPPPSPSARYGALNTLAALAPWMMRHVVYKTQMGALVAGHVGPAIAGAGVEPWVRAAACEVLGTLVKSGLKWEDAGGRETWAGVVALLGDTAVPVRVHGVLALTEGVIKYEEVREGMRGEEGSVGRVMAVVLALTEETELDVLNGSMEVLVDSYQTELLPYAVGLAGTLCEAYGRAVRESLESLQGVEADEGMELGMPSMSAVVGGAADDEDKTFHLMGLAKTLWTVVTAVEGSPTVLAEVAELIAGIVIGTLEAKYLDLLDSMYDLVDSITFKMRRVPTSFWRIFELTHGLIKGEGVDYISEMLPALDNFVSFGSAHILATPAYKEALIEMYVESQTNTHLGEMDRVSGCKLGESVLLNLRGGVDEALPLLVAHSLPSLPVETAHLRLARLEVLVGAVLYDPAKALSVFEALGVTIPVLETWFGAIEATYALSSPSSSTALTKATPTSSSPSSAQTTLKRVHDKRLSILALCALMRLPADALPEPVRAQLAPAALKLFKDYERAVEVRKALEAEADEDFSDDEDDEEDIGGGDGDEGMEDGKDVWDADSAYLDMLAEEGARLRAKSNTSSTSTALSALDAEFGADEDEDDDEDDEIEEELGFYTPLDGVDVYAAFRDALQLQGGGGMGGVSADLQSVWGEVLRKADGGSGTVAMN